MKDLLSFIKKTITEKGITEYVIKRSPVSFGYDVIMRKDGMEYGVYDIGSDRYPKEYLIDFIKSNI